MNDGTHLLPFVLGQVGLELEVRFELVGTKLALIGAVYHHDLLGLSVALLVLVGQRLYLDLRVTALRLVPTAERWISLSLAHTLLQLLWCLWEQTSGLLGELFILELPVSFSLFFSSCRIQVLKISQSYLLALTPLLFVCSDCGAAAIHPHPVRLVSAAPRPVLLRLLTRAPPSL